MTKQLKCYFFSYSIEKPRKNVQDHSLYNVGCEGEVEVAQFWQQI